MTRLTSPLLDTMHTSHFEKSVQTKFHLGLFIGSIVPDARHVDMAREIMLSFINLFLLTEILRGND